MVRAFQDWAINWYIDPADPHVKVKRAGWLNTTLTDEGNPLSFVVGVSRHVTSAGAVLDLVLSILDKIPRSWIMAAAARYECPQWKLDKPEWPKQQRRWPWSKGIREPANRTEWLEMYKPDCWKRPDIGVETTKAYFALKAMIVDARNGPLASQELLVVESLMTMLRISNQFSDWEGTVAGLIHGKGWVHDTGDGPKRLRLPAFDTQVALLRELEDVMERKFNETRPWVQGLRDARWQMLESNAGAFEEAMPREQEEMEWRERWYNLGRDGDNPPFR
ncbi:hypothetical protein B0T25DRAFT_536244, partial [Lasiosphaeria hispida]